MSVYKRGGVWWFDFIYAGQRIQESAKTSSKTIAKDTERRRRHELEQGFNNVSAVDQRKERLRTIADTAHRYLASYALRQPKSLRFAQTAVGHVVALLGSKRAVEINADTTKDYQDSRLREKAAHKSINEEVGFLLRMLGTAGDAIRLELRRQKKLRLPVQEQPGKAFNVTDKDGMMAQAARSRSPLILPALTLALNAGMRDSEMRHCRWNQIDFAKMILTVGDSKSPAGTGRTIPLNSEIMDALVKHARWYVQRFGELRPEWFVFPRGRGTKMDPSRPVRSLKTAWGNVLKRSNVTGRWHDTRHTLITELAESGAGDQTIMDIAGHVSRQMLARYSHIRTQAKRAALETVLERRKQARSISEPESLRKSLQ
jgi:integrase